MRSTPNLYSDSIGHVFREDRSEVFFLSVEAYPEPGSPDFGTAGGAFINCYLDADSLRDAELAMLEILREEGWRPYRLEGWEVTCAERAQAEPAEAGEPSQRDMVEEALNEGYAQVIYAWDIDADDAVESIRAESGRA